MSTPSTLPQVRLKIARRSAHPWIFQKMVEKPGVRLAPGTVVDVLDRDGSILAGSTAPPDGPAFPEPLADVEHTTLVLLATDALLTKSDCFLLAQTGHHGLARTLEPSHTRFDGDLVIAVATGVVETHLDRLRVAVADVVAEAVRSAVRAN